LYKGVTLTALRQGMEIWIKFDIKLTQWSLATNQAANFTAYQEFKRMARNYQNLDELPSYQHLILGGISGAMGRVTCTIWST
jgi:solute carrier family 25 citrate transporter 1